MLVLGLALGTSAATASHVDLRGDFEPTWSPDGSQIAFTSTRDGNENIYIMRADGSNPQRLTNEPAADYEADWGRNGRIVFASDRISFGDDEIYVVNADGSGLRQVTNDAGNWDFKPEWSPDGTMIAFAKTDGPRIDVYIVRADGTGLRNVTRDVVDEINSGPAWSPDGMRIAFSSAPRGGSTAALRVVDVNGRGLRTLTSATTLDLNPDWSPDGTSVVFSRARQELYVIGADGSNERRLDSGPGADFPTWSPDGRRVAFSAVTPRGVEIIVVNDDGSGRTILTAPARVCVVPRVVGRTLAGARRAIVRAGCVVGAVRSVRGPRGRIVAQSPSAGTRLARGGKVSLRVGRGR